MWAQLLLKRLTHIVPERMHSYRHTALSEILNAVGLWEKYYYALFDFTLYFSSDVGFTNIVVRSTDSLVQRQSTECQLCDDNVKQLPSTCINITSSCMFTPKYYI